MKKTRFLSIIAFLVFFVFSGAALASSSDKDKDHDHKKAESKYSDLDRANKAGEIRGIFSRCDVPGMADTFAYIVGRSFSALLDTDTGSFTLSYVPAGTYSLAFVQDGKVILFLDGVEVRKQRLTDVGVIEFCPDNDGDGFNFSQDCNDSDPSINPSAVEVCDGVDNNCDGQIDEGNPNGGAACNTHAPGVCAQGVTSCQNGTLTCQQTNTASADVCGDGLDNNCDGSVDESCAQVDPDRDFDGYPASIDCNNFDPRINPGTSEVCGDGIDNNCNGLVDENCVSQCALGETVCNGQCANLSSNASNCGACGTVCQAGAICSSGVCQ